VLDFAIFGFKRATVESWRDFDSVTASVFFLLGTGARFGPSLTSVCQAPGLVEVRLHPFHRCDGRGGTVQEFSFNLDWWAVVA